MKAPLTATQAAVLLFIFLTGSSIINIPAPLIAFSGNTACLSLLTSAGIGLALLYPMLYMARRFRQSSYVQYAQRLIGKPLALLFALALLMFQFHVSAGIVLDIAMFLKSSMMRETRSWLFVVMTFLAIAMTVRVGIGKIASMFGLVMASVMLCVGIIFVMASPHFEPSYLLPLFENGPKPYWHGVIFTFGFPYQEILLYTMILQLVDVRQDDGLGKKMTLAVLLNALTLALVTLSTQLTLGAIAGERKYSMYEVSRTIEITETFQRIEALMGYSMIVASFMKATLVLFMVHLTCNHMLGLREERLLVLPLALLGAVIALTALTRGEARWNFIVSSVHPLWGFASVFVPFAILCVVALFRRTV